MKGLINRILVTAITLVAGATFYGCKESGSSSSTVRGCITKTATNYNAAATEDDGSCVLPPTPPTIPIMTSAGLSNGNENTVVSAEDKATATNEDGGAIYFFKEGVPWASLNKTTGAWTGTRSDVTEDKTETGKIWACNTDLSAVAKVMNYKNRETQISFFDKTKLKSETGVAPYDATKCSAKTDFSVVVSDVPGHDKDTESPKVAISSPVNGESYTSHITSMTHSATDNVGVISCQYSTDKGVTKNDTTCNETIVGLNSAEGLNDWRAYATDAAGNIGEKKIEFTVDTSGDPPEDPLEDITEPDSITGQTNNTIEGDANSLSEGASGVNYSASFLDDSSGDFTNLYINPATGVFNFDAVGYENKTGSLEVILTRDSDGATKTKTIPINLTYDNPLVTSLIKSFGTDGTVTYTYDATSDAVKLDKINIGLNGVPGYSSWENVNLNEARVNLETPIVDRDPNEISFYVQNLDGDSKTNTDSFTPATEAEARAKIEEILEGAGLVFNSTYFRDSTLKTWGSSNSNCTIAEGEFENISIDYKILYNGKWATINFASFDDNLTIALSNYDKLRYCGDTANDLQISRDPEYSIENKINAFKNNEFIDVE